ncbi:MAG: glycosyltransferase family 4 protein [bacterium]
MITRLNIGGVAFHAILLTRHVGKLEGRSLLVAGEVDPHEGDMLNLALSNGIRVVKIATLRNSAGLREDLASFIGLYRLFRRERPSIADLHMTKARVLGGIAARLAGVPIVLETFHGTLFEGYYGPLRTKILVAVERIIARLMDGIIAVSERVAADLVARRIAPRERIHVILPGLDLDRFDASSAAGRLRASLGVNDGSPIVGVVARLVPIKGLQTFVAAAALVAKAVPSARFVIIGDGPERLALELQSKALGLSDRLTLIGWRRDVEDLYQDIDVVVLPSKNEGTPVTVIEAMAAGRAIVATQVGGVPDVVTSGVDGILVSAGDIQALAEAIVQLLRDPQRRCQMGKAARQTAQCRFSIDRLVTDIDGLYRSLLPQ